MEEISAIHDNDSGGASIPFLLKVTMNDLVQDWNSKIDFPTRQAAEDWLARNKDNPSAIQVTHEGGGKFTVVIAS
jgi:hypothetical protein